MVAPKPRLLKLRCSRGNRKDSEIDVKTPYSAPLSLIQPAYEVGFECAVIGETIRERSPDQSSQRNLEFKCLVFQYEVELP